MGEKKKLDPRRWADLPEWNELPGFMRTDAVRPYYDKLSKHKVGLKLKRVFDVTAGSVLLVILAIPMGVISVAIKLDSPGPVLYRQERVTTYGKILHGYKFQTELFSNKYNQNSGIISKNGRFI